jgi:FtsP/CotA-like multicopper oxidase with cupredoxin domain
MIMDRRRSALHLNRRDLFKLSGGILLGSAAALRPSHALAQFPLPAGCGVQDEPFPTSPLILNPFNDSLPIPVPLKPVPKSELASWAYPPGPGQQDCDGAYHQVWPSALGLPEPLYYRIKLHVAAHSFTTSRVQPIDKNGLPIVHPDGIAGPRKLPDSTIYGFNGTFPGPMIYARYGQPACVRFENDLEANPLSLDRCDFGDPEYAFLTHLHNGHTACESDGNPHWRPTAYRPTQWCDNMYLNWPASGLDGEKQSFFWFHDHRMDHTGANVYKGMVGLYPIYDPKLDPGNEAITTGLRLPGVPNASTGRIDYDIPLAFYDCALDDGVTPHQDFHNGCGETHPEWWGKTFFRHYPNHGFVGDVFTVNGTAYPVLEVKRRKYRFRCLDASIARIYELVLMSSTCGPVAAPGKQGQYSLPDGQQSMQFTQIATDGGLMPFPIVRNSFELWPAKRREVVVDFTRYMDGSPTKKGDVIYLVNIKQMTNGRKPNDSTITLDDGTIVSDPLFDPNYRVPLLKIVIGDDPPMPDVSVVPKALRPLIPLDPLIVGGAPRREFELQRSGAFGGETEWLINGFPFEPTVPLAFPQRGVPEVWTIRNGGGGWVHPLHLHMEEHRVIARNGVPTPFNRAHPDDESREDVVALGPGESVDLFRNFRTFLGPYVTHCHNLAHEDHAMMFGWEIVP